MNLILIEHLLKSDRYKVFTCTILFVVILIIASLQYSSVNPRETQTFPCMSEELIYILLINYIDMEI